MSDRVYLLTPVSIYGIVLFDFVPCIVIVAWDGSGPSHIWYPSNNNQVYLNNSIFWTSGAIKIPTCSYSNIYGINMMSLINNTLSWYFSKVGGDETANIGFGQLNVSECVYNYIAIG